jgi:glycosyltransferase involved in cell wall biosynthesis
MVPVTLRTQMRQLIAPFSFPQAARVLQGMIERIQPELIHAMRIPYEGMIASKVMRNIVGRKGNLRNTPLLISVWGNDFTLHAKSTRLMAYHTRKTLQTCDALLTDCQRDERLATELGFDNTKPRIVLPGGGGVQMDIFYPAQVEQNNHALATNVEQGLITIINPRGFRAYVRNDTFFHALPMVMEKYPQVIVVCPSMRGESQAQKWIMRLGISDKVELLPTQSPQQMAELFRQSQVSVSITTHDGTPNTLLEAMACGCFPIAGDIESLREWITPGENGLLVDPGDATALASAILSVIANPVMRRQVRERNLDLVKEWGEYNKCMQMAEEFYGQLISNN